MPLPRPMSMSRWTAMLVAALAVAWYVFGDTGADRGGIGPEGVVIDGDDPKLVAMGRKVYADHCASCHGANLEGQPDWRVRNDDGKMPAPPHDETGHTWHHPDAALFAMTKYGREAMTGISMDTEMPVYNGVLTDEEIAASLAYIKSTWPPDIRAKHDALNERTRATAE